jgi:uncharacterized protein (DUF1800 family)
MRLLRKTLTWALVITLALPASFLSAGEKPLDEHKRALHALNRLTFGPRPGEVERVRALGVEKWIEAQLSPSKLDDQQLAARLAPMRTLEMDTREMMVNYPPPQLIRAIAEGRAPMPRDPELRARYESQIERYKERQARGEQDGPPRPEPGMRDDEMSPEERRATRQSADKHIGAMKDMTTEQRLEALMKLSPEERRAVVQALTPQERRQMLGEITPEQRQQLMSRMAPQAAVVGELQQAKLVRAIHSERQLEEVMTDFWFNHFNVFVNKGADRYYVTSYEREAIRPHALGKFHDLLTATAEHPAMLFYLDNWLSVGPNSDFAKNGPGGRRGFGGDNQQMRNRRMNDGGLLGQRRRQAGRDRAPDMQTDTMRRQQQQQPQMRRGLNENYARELMELHTLGVDGGYTQADVTEVAKVFTGWTMQQPRRGGSFTFDGRMHEPGDKMVLGQKISGGGEGEGKKVLEMLARHPATAKFISTKLAQRFVSDNPPPALVERMAQTFRKTDGDIKEMLRTLFRSSEFWSPESYRAKVKTPLEFVASAARATGVEVENALPLVRQLNQMGMPLYGAQPPTGYDMAAETWVNSAALLSRLNFALAMGSGRLPGLRFEPQRLLNGAAAPSDNESALALLERLLLAGDVSSQTHATILKQLSDPQVTSGAPEGARLGVVAGLLLGSPEFQRR